MRYDDRLRTVLAQPAADPRDRAVRWRQLVELLARSSAADRSLLEQAVAAVRSDAPLVDEQVRMAAARAIASLPAPPELVSAFAADRLGVAAPLLAAARLSASEWAEVTAAASPECMRFIAALRGEAPAEPAGGGGGAIPSISEVVARVERLRQARQPSQDPPEPRACAPEQREQPRLFRWECDQSGAIDWVDSIPRGSAIGRSITEPVEAGVTDPAIERAFARRLPLREASLELAGGRWAITGSPIFDPSSGRFAGYRGIAERARPAVFATRDPDSLRELVHEIRTPLNAIVGFAEIIGGEYLGPAARPYRERAAEIVAEAQVLLGAIDDMDFAARLRSRSADAPATGLAAAIGRVAGELEDSGASFAIESEPATTLDPALSERLVSRFCRTVIDLSDEPPSFALEEDATHCILSVRTPPGEPGPGLQLVQELARIAGGDVRSGGGRLALLLPKE